MSFNITKVLMKIVLKCIEMSRISEIELRNNEVSISVSQYRCINSLKSLRDYLNNCQII